jgi:hypothetical protein
MPASFSPRENSGEVFMDIPAAVVDDVRDGRLSAGHALEALRAVPGIRATEARGQFTRVGGRPGLRAASGVALALPGSEVSAAGIAAVTVPADGAHAILQQTTFGMRAAVVIASPNAPSEYRFALQIPDGWQVVPDAFGGFLLFDGVPWAEDRPPAAIIGSPWAFDAAGAPVPVAQELDGTDIVLRVEHAGSAYPVVADPAYWPVRCSSTGTSGTTDAYMSGMMCPTQAFFTRHGYFPVWGSNQGVTRVVEQRGECSWYPDTGPYWDFQIPCKGHDYCWDLVRMRLYVNAATYGGATEGRCDQIFRDDLFRHCAQRGWATRTLCQAEANLVHAAVLPFSP